MLPYFLFPSFPFFSYIFHPLIHTPNTVTVSYSKRGGAKSSSSRNRYGNEGLPQVMPNGLFYCTGEEGHYWLSLEQQNHNGNEGLPQVKPNGLFYCTGEEGHYWLSLKQQNHYGNEGLPQVMPNGLFYCTGEEGHYWLSLE